MARQRQHSHYEQLKNKWVVRHQALSEKLWNKHKESLVWLRYHSKQFAVGSVGGLLLLAGPQVLQPFPQALADQQEKTTAVSKNAFIISNLSPLLPEEMRSLTTDEEVKVAEVLSRDFGMSVSAELEGKRLNRSYGLIGAEQHLARYPGDTMETHFDNPDDANTYYSSGMAPGLGAWGYFAPSQDQFTDKDAMREKYYIAVQTFLSPDFTSRVSEYRDFFKFRKMLVVNPQNGKGVVAVIGDAGPAAWTGKHLGGSPEVMKYLERQDGRQRGPVLYFFIDDPKDQIPLGPVTL